jgi:hypothetical protein
VKKNYNKKITGFLKIRKLMFSESQKIIFVIFLCYFFFFPLTFFHHVNQISGDGRVDGLLDGPVGRGKDLSVLLRSNDPLLLLKLVTSSPLLDPSFLRPPSLPPSLLPPSSLLLTE